MKFSTKLIHGNYKLEYNGATNAAIYMSNAYSHTSPYELENIFQGKAMGYAYTRISNPTVVTLERRMASLEGGICSTATASGMSAIYIAVTNIVEAGDEIIAASGIYAGTYTLLYNLKNIGIKVKFLDTLDKENLLKVITDKTKLVYAETIGNPKLDVLDIEKVGQICRDNNIIFMVDSTISTPYLINSIKYGADIVIHSTSKYLNGTSNAIGGIIVDGGSKKYRDKKYEHFHEFVKKYGSFAFTSKLKNSIGRDIGAAISPFNAFLTLTGIETLSLRMQQHCKNAVQVAKFLEKSEKVKTVNYPNLESSKYYELAQKYYKGGAAGIVTFRLGSKEKAFKFIENLKLIFNLPNIGDTKTIIIHPASTICAHNTEKEKNEMAVYDDLLRLSVGIEDMEDIIADIETALKAI